MKSQKKNSLFKLILHYLRRYYPTIIIVAFFTVSFLILSIVKHINFLSGYDLSIIDQAIWKYSQFKNPVNTTHVYYDAAIYTDHLEIILILLSPLYWIFKSAITLIVLQVISIAASGVAIYLIAKQARLKKFVANALLINYFSFYGIQFAIWSDVHSLVLSLGFLSWFVYFLRAGKPKLTILFLILAVMCKEDIALLTLLLSCVIFIKTKSRTALSSIGISLIYLLFVFLIYFPLIMGGYKYAHPDGIFHDPNVLYLINTPDKQSVIFYSLGSFGFLPLLAPLYLIPFVGDLAHYFILGNSVVTSSQNIFGHYRSTIPLLLVIPTIIVISKMKKYNNKAIGIYLLTCTLLIQYFLHLPLSYLSKSWFWSGSPERQSINAMIQSIPQYFSLATQSNLTPHLTHRDDIYTLFPVQREFSDNSPCGEKLCKWFSVGGNPSYLLVDMGSTWNPLHLLTTREEFNESLSNIEKNGNIKLIKSVGTTRFYRIIKKI